MASQTVA
jgi:hypothetical protein